jgi:hypothetical protein
VFVPSALAAAPEAPTLTVEEPVHATTATFHGILNPVEAAEPNNKGGVYKFFYNVGATCTGGHETKPSGLALGGVHEELPAETVTGLTANTEYAVCLQITNLEGETTLSAAVPFKTGIPPEAPETKDASAITATSAKLEGTLNPLSTTKVSGYFAYSNAEGSSCTEGPQAGLEEFEEKEGEAIAVHSTVGLEPDRKYKVCLIATNSIGESVQGNEVVLESLAPPPVIVSESAYSPSQLLTTAQSLEERLEAAVNPEDQETECHFQYGTASVTEHEVQCEQGNALNGGEQGAGVTLTGLSAGTVYHYRIVLKNAKGEETKGTGAATFETQAPPTVQTTAAEAITGTAANLGGELNAGGEAKYYVEYGTAPCAVTCGAKTYELGSASKTLESVTPIVVNGLLPLTTYHYWLVATNAAAGGPVHGAAMQFTTKLAPPSVETGIAEGLTQTSAELTGTLDPGGEATYYFEYGTEPCGGSSCGTATAASALSGATQQAAGPVAVSGLAPNTTYYYWLVAKNTGVTQPVDGEARQFTTPKTGAQEAAEAAAQNKPAEELAASLAAKSKLEAEAKQQEEAAAASAAVKQKQYEEVSALTATLEREAAEAAKQKPKQEPAKAVKCKKGKKLSHGKCVKKSKSKKAKKTSKSNRGAKS